MALQFDEDVLDNFKSPLEFKERVEALQSQLPPILDEFKKYYVFFNKNPEYPEYEQMFQNVKGNLNNVNSQLFTLSNDVQINTDKINEMLFALNKMIQNEKKTNRELKIKLGIVEHKNNAASEVIYDYKQIYESGYLRNWGLFLSIIIVGLTISKTFKKQ
jgi:hypothetical protein